MSCNRKYTVTKLKQLSFKQVYFQMQMWMFGKKCVVLSCFLSVQYTNDWRNKRNSAPADVSVFRIISVGCACADVSEHPVGRACADSEKPVGHDAPCTEKPPENEKETISCTAALSAAGPDLKLSQFQYIPAWPRIQHITSHNSIHLLK